MFLLPRWLLSHFTRITSEQPWPRASERTAPLRSHGSGSLLSAPPRSTHCRVTYPCAPVSKHRVRVKEKVAQLCPTLCDPTDYTVHEVLQVDILAWVAFPFSGGSSQEDLPNVGIEPRSPALWADSLPAEPQGKPKNTEVGSLSRLQQIFPTQESNQGLLHCRRILCQLSQERSPNTV